MDDAGHARLTDFGLAIVVPDNWDTEPTTDGHAVRCAAPEILGKEGPVSKESDVYSFSMVFIEVLAHDLTTLAASLIGTRLSLGNRHFMIVRLPRPPLVFYLGTDQDDQCTRA